MLSFRKLCFLSIALFANSAFSGVMGEAVPDGSYDGFYIGADIGVADLIDSQSTTTSSHQFSATGIVGGGLAGFDYTVYDRFKLGIEGFINANGMNISSDAIAAGTSYQAKVTYNAGIRLLPGFEVYPNAVAHLILGYSNAKFSVRDNGDYGFIDQDTNRSGFQCGLGMKVGLIYGLSLRADALYTTYGQYSAIGASNTPGLLYQTYTNKFSTLEGDLTLLYKFN